MKLLKAKMGDIVVFFDSPHKCWFRVNDKAGNMTCVKSTGLFRVGEHALPEPLDTQFYRFATKAEILSIDDDPHQQE